MMPVRLPGSVSTSVATVGGQMVPGNRQVVPVVSSGSSNPAVIVRPQSGAPSFQQRTPEQQQAPSQQPQEQMDPILRAKEILPHLKEALVNLMAVASQNFAVSVSIDDMQKIVDGSGIPRFDKCLEHFFSLCDQLEVQLMTAHRQITQTLYSFQHAPLLKTANFKVDSQIYSNYQTLVDVQLNYAKEVYNLLTNCCKALVEQQTKIPLSS